MTQSKRIDSLARTVTVLSNLSDAILTSYERTNRELKELKKANEDLKETVKELQTKVKVLMICR